MSESERLFRDAEGAALERVARLEDENRRLREEIARVASRSKDDQDKESRHPPRDPPVRSRPDASPAMARFVLMAIALPVGMMALLLTVGPRAHPRPYAPPIRVTLPPSTVQPLLYEAPTFEPTPVLAAPTTESECDVPFVYDSLGNRRPKAECASRSAAEDPSDLSCTPPFFYDVRGIKHYKRHCLR